MRRLFSMMANQVQSTAAALRHWWSTLSPDPSTWVPFTWVLAALVLLVLLVLILRPRRPAAGRRPELLISHGELRFAGAPDRVASSLHAPAEGAFALSMTVSNLSAVPVQLLELAVRTNGSTAPTTAEVPAVLPPHGAVEVSAELREAGGDEGTLELFVYVPDMPPKTFRVRARLLWEPWNARFRVLPLDQKVEPARRLAERGLQRREAARRSPARAPGRRTAADRRAYEARFPGVELENDVRFEPRPESARPRASWPAEPTSSAALPAARDPRRATGGVRPDAAAGGAAGGAAGRGPSGGPDERWVVGSDAVPGESDDENVTIWPPRRSRTSSSPQVGSSEEGTRRPAGRGSRGERLFTDTPIAEDRPDDLLVEEGPGRVQDRGTRSGGGADAAESDMQPWEARQRAERRREAQRREAERADAERAGAERAGGARAEDARTEAARIEADRTEAERLASLRRETLRRERERRERARRDAERTETERRERERLDAERQEAQRQEAQRAESEQHEAERREAERGETERLEAQRAREARAARQRATEARLAEELRGEKRPAAADRPAADRPAADRPAPTPSGADRPADRSGGRPADRPAVRPASPDDAARTERGGSAPSQRGSPGREGGGDAPAGGGDGLRPERSGDAATPEKDEAPRPRLEFPDEF